MTNKNDIKTAIITEPWESLYDPCNSKATDIPKTSSSNKTKPPTHSNNIFPNLTSHARILAYDATVFTDSQFQERQQRLHISARQIEDAKKELLRNELIKEVRVGKSLFLAATSKLYEMIGVESPYKRNVSDIHSFLVLLTTKLVEPNPLVESVKQEVSIGDANSTVDNITYMKDGQQWAYEITLSCSNVSANAAKLQNKGFSQIIFVCRDFDLKKAAWAKLRNAGFDPDFLATIRCTIFSTLIRQRKDMKLKDI